MKTRLIYILILGMCFWHMRADKIWHGDSTPNVANENLVIHGECRLTDNHTISALDTNVTVTVEHAGSELPIVRGAGKVLELITAADHEIIFSITNSNDLAFEGGYVGINHAFFRIIQRGPGTVRWRINGGRTITLRNSTKAGETGGDSVQYFISLENPTNGTVIQRGDSSSLHAGFKILNNSLMTFIAPTKLADHPTERGALVFDTTNSNGYGRTYIELGEQAGLVIAGHYVTNLTDPTLVSIDLSKPAGRETLFVIDEPTTAGYFASLLLINGNVLLPQLYCDPTRTGDYTGVQSGFILGTNSSAYINNNAYFDFVGTTTNTTPLISSAAVLDGRLPEKVLKDRNSSALIIDGAPAGTVGAVPVRLCMDGASGLFLRSGADNTGVVTPTVDAGLSFTISPTKQITGAGNIVFDIEGTCTILGAATGTSVINVLSREVVSSGGYIEIGIGGPYFPKITFAKNAQTASSADYLAQYAKACCFINNRLNLSHVIIRHDDFFHVVNAVNTPSNSEPTYIGGDTFKLDLTTTATQRPRIALYNSAFNLHTSAALTGVDLLITNTSLDVANTTSFRFYQNGYKLDSGSGRALVLGTLPGSCAYDYATIVDDVSYLDVYQEVNQTPGRTHQLNLITAVNNNTVIQGITGNISTQYSIHTMYLGNESNIQIGSQSAPTGVTLSTYPTLNINGNFFSFMTQGGSIGQPSLSVATGQGALFVDKNGIVSIADTARAHFGMMVIQGDPLGVIDLPAAQVDFAPKVGLSRWAIDLTTTQQIIPEGSQLAEFTLDWVSVIKDYTGNGTNQFEPFVPVGAIGTPITTNNLYHIPLIKNCTVQRFQIKRARIGDPVQLMIGEKGRIRELSFLKGYDSAEAANGVIALENYGRVGLGNSKQNRESPNASVVLGVNGVTLVANGNGTVDLNEDVLIDTVCHIIAGPNFGAGSDVQTLYINAENPVTIRVKRSGVLDLSTFTTSKQKIVFGGRANIVFEPGARMLLGGGILQFTNHASLLIQNEIGMFTTAGTRVTDTDDFRAKFIGTGTIIFDQDSLLQIQKNSFLGIEWESLLDSISNTSFTLSIRDNAQLHVWAGALQIGNTASKVGSVKVYVELDGLNATLNIDSQGFFGIGAGIVDKLSSTPNSWLIGSLHNVDIFSLHVKQGFVKNNMIVNGASSNAALLAIGPATTYYLIVDDLAAYRAFGGGNMVRISSGVTRVYPVVLDSAYTDSTGDLKAVGLFASTALFQDSNNTTLRTQMASSGGTATNFFEVIRTKKIQDMAITRANFAQLGLGNNLYAYLWKDPTKTQDTIVRPRCTSIFGIPGMVPPEHSLAIGAVGLEINRDTGVLTSIKEII